MNLAKKIQVQKNEKCEYCPKIYLDITPEKSWNYDSIPGGVIVDVETYVFLKA